MTSFDMCLWVGIGCQRGVSKLAIQSAIESVFTEYDLDLATVEGIATVDRKANESGLIEYCRESGWFLKIYSPERLNSVTVTDPSQLISALVGTASVAEAAALCAAQTNKILVPKQIFRLDAEAGFVTVAIAQIDRSNINLTTHKSTPFNCESSFKFGSETSLNIENCNLQYHLLTASF